MALGAVRGIKLPHLQLLQSQGQWLSYPSQVALNSLERAYMNNPNGVNTNSFRKKSFSSPQHGSKFQPRGDRAESKSWSQKPKFRSEERSMGGNAGSYSENKKFRHDRNERFAPKAFGERRERSFGSNERSFSSERSFGGERRERSFGGERSSFGGERRFGGGQGGKPRFEKGPKNFAKKFGKRFEKSNSPFPQDQKNHDRQESQELPAELLADIAAAELEAQQNRPASKVAPARFKKAPEKTFKKLSPEIAKIEVEMEHASKAPEIAKIEIVMEENEPSISTTGSFKDFAISEKIQNAILDLGWNAPTPIQAQSIPYSLAGRDIIGCAQTGTGKTAAFTIPMLNRLIENPSELSLILAPTRELAFQIRDTIKELLTHVPDLRTALIIGGASYPEQVRSLAMGPRIVIATPGRLVDHLQNRTIRLSNVKFLVLDEADRMFDMGFAPQIDRIVRDIPNDRQTLLFSATFSKEVRELAKRTLKNPQEVSIGVASSPAEGVEQEVIEVRPAEKFDMLLDQLNSREGSILIFIATKHHADRMAKKLAEFGHSTGRIHGGLTMGQRKNAISGFRDQTFRILVATDIAARGLDISHVAHVINFDLPRDPEDYVHRIGRTARAGAKGKALSLVNNQDKDAWRRISRLLPKNCVPKVTTLAERQAERDSRR